MSLNPSTSSHHALEQQVTINLSASNSIASTSSVHNTGNISSVNSLNLSTTSVAHHSHTSQQHGNHPDNNYDSLEYITPVVPLPDDNGSKFTDTLVNMENPFVDMAEESIYFDIPNNSSTNVNTINNANNINNNTSNANTPSNSSNNPCSIPSASVVHHHRHEYPTPKNQILERAYYNTGTVNTSQPSTDNSHQLLSNINGVGPGILVEIHEDDLKSNGMTGIFRRYQKFDNTNLNNAGIFTKRSGVSSNVVESTSPSPIQLQDQRQLQSDHPQQSQQQPQFKHRIESVKNLCLPNNNSPSLRSTPPNQQVQTQQTILQQGQCNKMQGNHRLYEPLDHYFKDNKVVEQQHSRSRVQQHAPQQQQMVVTSDEHHSQQSAVDNFSRNFSVVDLCELSLPPDGSHHPGQSQTAPTPQQPQQQQSEQQQQHVFHSHEQPQQLTQQVSQVNQLKQLKLHHIPNQDGSDPLNQLYVDKNTGTIHVNNGNANLQDNTNMEIHQQVSLEKQSNNQTNQSQLQQNIYLRVRGQSQRDKRPLLKHLLQETDPLTIKDKHGIIQQQQSSASHHGQEMLNQSHLMECSSESTPPQENSMNDEMRLVQQTHESKAMPSRHLQHTSKSIQQQNNNNVRPNTSTSSSNMLVSRSGRIIKRRPEYLAFVNQNNVKDDFDESDLVDQVMPVKSQAAPSSIASPRHIQLYTSTESMRGDHAKKLSPFNYQSMEIEDTESVFVSSSHDHENSNDEDTEDSVAYGNDGKKSLPHKKRIPKKLKTSRKLTKCYKCSTCGEQFTSQTQFQQHKITHTQSTFQPKNFSNKPFMCEICNKGMETQKKFFDHLKSHYEPAQKYNCDICHEEFESPDALEEHQKVHMGVAYICAVCSKTFRSEALLRNHMKVSHAHVINTEETFSKPVPCTVCLKAFPSQAALEAHIANDHVDDVVEWTCEDCFQVRRLVK